MTKLTIRAFLIAALWLCGVTVASADSVGGFQEGVQYSRMSNPQPTDDPGKIEVMEVFWYGCSHCYSLEPHVEKWLEDKPEDVQFVRFPAIPSSKWEWFAKVYYTAQMLGVLEQVHGPLFKAIHDEKRKLGNADSMAAFFSEHGVSREKFLATLKSFAVVTKINRARQLTRRMGIDSVPTLVVNGTYKITGRMAGTGGNMFAVVDHLIENERAARASASAAGVTP